MAQDNDHDGLDPDEAMSSQAVVSSNDALIEDAGLSQDVPADDAESDDETEGEPDEPDQPDESGEPTDSVGPESDGPGRLLVGLGLGILFCLTALIVRNEDAQQPESASVSSGLDSAWERAVDIVAPPEGAIEAVAIARGENVSLVGSRASMQRQHDEALRLGATFYRTRTQLREAVRRGDLVEIRESESLTLARVSHPYTRPHTHRLLLALARGHRPSVRAPLGGHECISTSQRAAEQFVQSLGPPRRVGLRLAIGHRGPMSPLARGQFAEA